MIRLERVSKAFRVYQRPRDRLIEAFTGRPRHVARVVLDDVSFEVPRGSTCGLLGRNGAGKSTLLKLVMGVLAPDSGVVSVDGKTTGLLELGTGFNPALSGRANIAFNAALLGLTGEAVAARLDDILAFAELGAQIEAPLATYSSGMTMRLAFAIAIHADPDCFIVDEALAVGDAYFQQKCMRRIGEFRERGGTILVVSHDLTAIRALCDRAILLENGRVERAGHPREVADYYVGTILKGLHQSGAAGQDVEVRSDGETIGTGEVDLAATRLTDPEGAEISSVVSGARCRIVARVHARRAIDEPHYGLAIRDRYGRSMFESNSFLIGGRPPAVAAGEAVEVAFAFDCRLGEGAYSVSIGIANRGSGDGDFAEYLLLRHEALVLRVERDPTAIRFAGVINLDPRVSVASLGMEQGASDERV